MRIIPKNTKIKLQFFKNITIPDVLLAIISLAFISLAVTSNLPYKFTIAIVILMVVAPLYIPLGEIKLYQALGYGLKFLGARKKFSSKKRGKKNIQAISSILKYEDDLIKHKEEGFTGVVQITPIEFNLLSEHKQNYMIDNVISNILKGVGIYQEINFIKLEQPLIFDNYLKNEFSTMQELIQASESENLNEKEFRSRIEVLEDRINIIDNLNSNEKIFASNFYIAIHDIDKRSLKNSLSIIATSLNANGIETKQLNNSELITFTKYTYTNDFDEREFNQLKDNEKIKSTFPNKVKFKTMRVLQDNKQLTHFVINDYPLKVTNAWAEELFDIPNTKVVLKAVPVDRYKAIRRIDNTINELLSQRDLGRASYQLDKSTHIESLQALLESLQNDNEVFFDTTIIITAYDDLKQTTTKRFVKRKLRELGFKFNEMFGRQIDAYLSNSISKTNNLKIDRGINSSSLSASFPFVSNAILDDNGIFIGENNLPTFIDFFKRNDERVNSNMVVIGKSGSGKSFATKTILSHLASNNSKVFILDPENEYGKLANSLNGKVLDVASSKDGRINPFHIITSLDDENMDGTNNSYFAHLQFLEEFFKLILQGINPDSLELLNKLILEMYNSKNINAKTDLSTLKPSNYPIFQDIAELIDSKLETEKDDYTKTSLKVLSNYLSKFRRGGRNSALWNGFTTFRPQENFVCFNFQKLLANKNNIIANAQMLLVLKWLDNEIIKNRDYNTLNKANRKIIVAIDEAHVFIDEKYPIALDFMYQLAKRIRKYNGMQIVITQNIKDFVGSPDIARKSSAIINVSQYSLIFSLSPNDISDLITLYEKAGQINDSESDNIVNLPRGCAFIITSPSSRTNVRIIASEKIQEMFE